MWDWWRRWRRHVWHSRCDTRDGWSSRPTVEPPGGDLDLQARTETQLRYDLIMIRGQVYDLVRKLDEAQATVQLQDKTQAQLIKQRDEALQVSAARERV